MVCTQSSEGTYWDEPCSGPLSSTFAALVTNPSTEQSDLRFQKKMINRRQLLEKISWQKLLQQALPILNYLPRMMDHVFKVLFGWIFTDLMRLIRWVTGQVNHWSWVDRTNTALRWWKDYWWWRNQFTARVGEFFGEDSKIFLYQKPGKFLSWVEVDQLLNGRELVLKRSNQGIGFPRSTPLCRDPGKVLLSYNHTELCCWS